MIIACEQCQSRHRIDDEAVAPTGVQVRCQSCGNLWIVRPTTDGGSALDSLLSTHGEAVKNLPVAEVMGPAEVRPRTTMPQERLAVDANLDNELFGDMEPAQPEEAPSLESLTGPPSRPVPVAPASGPAAAISRPATLSSTKVGGVINLVMTIVLLSLLGAAAIYFVFGERLARAAAVVNVDAMSDFRGVRLLSARALLYPRDSGKRSLVVTGEAENTSSEAQALLDVVVQLRGADGRIVARGAAPLGLSLGPVELAAIDDAPTLLESIRAKVGTGLEIAPGARAPYTLVLLDPPQNLTALRQDVFLDQGTPIPAPVPEFVGPPAPPAEVDDGSKTKSKAKKAKTKIKGKAKGKKAVVSP